MVVTIPYIISVAKVMVHGAIISAALLTCICNAYGMDSEPEVSSEFSSKFSCCASSDLGTK